MSDLAMRLAGDLGHPFTRVLTLSFDAWLCQWEGDVEATRWRAADALALATEQGFAFWIGWDEILQGWAWAAGGRHEEGVAQLRAGLQHWHALGSELGNSYYYGLLSSALAGMGDLTGARRALDGAEAIAARKREGFWLPELCRMRGELALRDGAPPSQAREIFATAIERARAQGAVALAARAERSLSAAG